MAERKIRAVLFDLDGVLVDAREWHYQALNQALRLFGFEVDRYDHLVTYDGLPTRKKLEMLSIEKDLPRSLHAFINQLKQENTFDLIYSQCRPSFNHRFALSQLKRDGYRMAVCSNSIQKTIRLMLDRSGISPFFEICLSAEDVAQPKPHPEIYQRAMEALQVKPSECVVLEDNQHGIAAAEAAGASVLKVQTPRDVTYAAIRAHIAGLERR